LAVLFFVLYFVKSAKFKQNRLFIYLGAYAVARFLLEFLRGDLRGGLFGPVSPAQFLSMCIVVFLAVFVPVYYLKIKKGDLPESGMPPDEHNKTPQE